MSRSPRSALRLFIAHPSHYLTDCQPHGDGLIAHAILCALAERGHTLHVAAASVDLRRALPAGVHLYPLPMHSRYSALNQGLRFRLEYAMRVRRLFRQLHRQQPFDAIHQLNPVVTGLSTFLFGLGCPVLLGPVWPSWKPEPSGHGLGAMRARVERELLGLQFRAADGVLVPTPASASRLPEALQASGRTIPFPLGIDADYFAEAAAQPGPDTPTILFLANLQERKGIFVLLEAWEKVAATMPVARLRIAGTGEQLKEIRRRVEGSAFRDRVDLLGNVERERLADTMAACTVYCLPSFGEPYGMSALEAMAAGRPLVVTDAGGLRYLLPDEGGFKVPPRDAGALADALLRVLRAPELARRMGNINRRQVDEHHTWPRVAQRLESVYTTLATKNAARPLGRPARFA